MKIQLIDGEFNPGDALELITKMVHAKIKFHENKIAKNATEEDVKGRESKIKRLQKDLFELRKHIASSTKGVQLNAIINIG